jgi:hypothetical protein
VRVPHHSLPDEKHNIIARVDRPEASTYVSQTHHHNPQITLAKAQMIIQSCLINPYSVITSCSQKHVVLCLDNTIVKLQYQPACIVQIDKKEKGKRCVWCHQLPPPHGYLSLPSSRGSPSYLSRPSCFSLGCEVALHGLRDFW